MDQKDQDFTCYDCYDCMYRKDLPGSCHSKCVHPDIHIENEPLMEILSILASVNRTPPMFSCTEKMGVKLNPHGVKNGWCNFPLNFDPVWIDQCKSFKRIE